MSSQQVLGIVLILTAVVDIVLGFVVIGPRIPNADTRRIVTLGLIAGAGVLAALGLALLVRGL